MSNQIIKQLSFQDHPIHLFLFNGQVAFLAQQVGDVLGIQNVSRSIRESKVTEEGVDFDIVSSKSLEATTKNVFALPDNTDKVAILYQSGFFLFVLRSNKPMAVPFTRWTIREAIPQAFHQRELPELSEKVYLKLVELEMKGSLFAKQALVDHGHKSAPERNKQLSFDDGGNYE